MDEIFNRFRAEIITKIVHSILDEFDKETDSHTKQVISTIAHKIKRMDGK